MATLLPGGHLQLNFMVTHNETKITICKSSGHGTLSRKNFSQLTVRKDGNLLFQTEPVFANRIRHDVLASFDHLYCSANFTRWTRGTVFHVLRIRRKPNPGRKSLMEESPCALRSPKAPNFQKDDQSGASYSDLGKGRENGSEKVGNILRKLLPMISDRMTNRMYSVHCVVYVYMYGGYTFIKHDLWRREVTCALL